MVKVRKEIIIIGVLLLLVIVMIGVSYAAFRFMGEGTKLNKITTGSITMEYTESSNTISLTGALPTTDETGKKRLNPGEYFDFTVSSTIVGDVNINYEISAKEIGEGTIDGKYIKLYLTRIEDDGTEEELMAPEVYNEESTSNDYTGRPAGEMSLYTNSMNSSESNKYRLRMYVDESYNPQDDGGGLQFSVQINVYGKDGEKYVPTAVDTLLEKVNAEGLDYNSASDDEKKEMWTFSHPETEQTDALTDYRYIGADPNNYVEFNDELWRIIGVFTVDDGTGKKEQRLKIIRNESRVVTWNSNNTNDWPNSTLNISLSSGNFLYGKSKSMIENAVWYLGGISDYSNAIVSQWYTYERGTTVYEGRNTSWVGKVGLMYPSDYGYATSGGATTDRNTCLNKELSNWNELSDCYTNDWIYDSSKQWTITPAAYNFSSVFFVNDSDVGGSFAVTTFINERPVVFLKSNIKIVNGDGSSGNPYVLSF